ncbi:MAG: hypothetical protein WC373_14005 [Smithella sp.]
MDGYIALYSAVAMLLAGRYFKHRRLLDLMSAMSCLALISNVKNEGILIALIGMLSIAITGALSNKLKLIELKKYFSISRLGWLAIIIAPCILWSVFYKYKWGLTNDLKIGTTESFLQIINRFSDGATFPLIIGRTIFHDESAVLLALIVFIAALVLMVVSKKYTVSWIPAFITAILYYCGMITIYLLTPHDINWHISTSVSRTMLTFSNCMLAGTFFILKEVEDASSEGKYKK